MRPGSGDQVPLTGADAHLSISVWLLAAAAKVKKTMSSTEDQPAGVVPVINLPNALTVLRIMLVPVFVWAFLLGTANARWAALLIFIVASITDYLDGYLARSWNLETNFGRLADPLADKALTLSAFVLLSIDGPISWFWVFTVLVAIREVGITVLREVLRRRGIVVSASAGGKLKTVLQISLIILMLVPWATFVLSSSLLAVIYWVAVILTIVTLGVTLISGGQYLSAVWQESQPRKQF